MLLFILDLRGKLYKLQDNGKAAVYMDIAKLRPKFINEPGLGTGFGSFAFHPEFAKNGLLYTTHTEQAGSDKADFSYADSIHVAMQWVLTEWKTEQPGAPVFFGPRARIAEDKYGKRHSWCSGNYIQSYSNQKF